MTGLSQDDWSWNFPAWWTPDAQQSSNGAWSSGANVPQDTAKNRPPPPNVSAEVSECAREYEDCPGSNAWTDDELVRGSAHADWCIEFRSTTNSMRVPNLTQMLANGPVGFDDSLVECMQAGRQDLDTVRQWCLRELLLGMVCVEYPVLPSNETSPWLRSLSGKTLDVQGRKIVHLGCGNGHSLSVQLYVCTGTPAYRFHWSVSHDCCCKTSGLFWQQTILR